MNIAFIITIFIVVLLVYGGLTYYIGLAGWRFIVTSGLNLSGIVYWTILWIVALAFFISRGADRWLPKWLNHPLEVIGAYWLGVMTYLTLILFMGKIIFILNAKFQFIPEVLMNHPKLIIIKGIAVLSLLFIIISVGFWNARNPHVVYYEVQLDKRVTELQELHIVMMSDLHLGRLVNRKQLEKIINQVSQLNADIVLMPGDIIDDKIDPFVEQDMMSVFHMITPPLGIYASMGNHEYIGGQVEKAEAYFNEAGIKVLRDEYVKVADEFYLIGREDKSIERFQGSARKPLEEILQGANRDLPIIMLDHQPVDISEAIMAGVDIQFSGHTHRGQLFPFRIFTRKIFQVDWGHEKIENLNVIVTSGVGTWGPPLRVGHRSEIISVKVKFQEGGV